MTSRLNQPSSPPDPSSARIPSTLNLSSGRAEHPLSYLHPQPLGVSLVDYSLRAGPVKLARGPPQTQVKAANRHALEEPRRVGRGSGRWCVITILEASDAAALQPENLAAQQTENPGHPLTFRQRTRSRDPTVQARWSRRQDPPLTRNARARRLRG